MLWNSIGEMQHPEAEKKQPQVPVHAVEIRIKGSSTERGLAILVDIELNRSQQCVLAPKEGSWYS